MTEEQQSDISLPKQQIAKPVRTLEALLKLYTEGHRNFSGSDLRGVTVDIIDPEIDILDFQDVILRGSNLKAINLYRSSHILKVDLTGSDFSECNLQGANLSRSRLDQCNFTDSDLRGVNFLGSFCRGSDFIRSKLPNIFIHYDTDFTASDFTEADLRLSKLSGKFSYSKFYNTNFQKASFSSFYAQGADFSNANLQGVEFSTPKTVSFQYSYYNSQTKLGDVDPIIMGMELVKDDISAED
jgi:uncharacterized protein YjbI with pentapeptide repeats